ncbi:hypothetical protein STEG23_030953, partial [Scotinomys teguina]
LVDCPLPWPLVSLSASHPREGKATSSKALKMYPNMSHFDFRQFAHQKQGCNLASLANWLCQSSVAEAVVLAGLGSSWLGSDLICVYPHLGQ